MTAVHVFQKVKEMKKQRQGKIFIKGQLFLIQTQNAAQVAGAAAGAAAAASAAASAACI